MQSLDWDSSGEPSLAAAYRDKNVLVIGGSGFMGYNLVCRLSRLGAQVSVAARGITIPAARYPAGVDAIRLDLADPASFGCALDGREVIFIAAGATGAVNSINSPIEDLQSNLSGQLNLLQAIRGQSRRPRLVLASSRLVYGVAQYLPVNESHPTDPTSAYGVHKLTAEKYHLLYRHLHGLPTTVARITVAYGPHTPANSAAYGVVNRFADSLVRGEPITVYGTGEQVRDFVYIDDVVEALLRLGACDKAIGRVFNIGHGRPVTLTHLAEALIRVAGGGEYAHVPWPDDAEKVETGNFYTDISLIRELTGWTPRMPLEEGLRNVLQYMRHCQADPPNVMLR